MEFYREIDSTNRVVKTALAQGCSQGFCVAALEQTAGYGRQGRTWSSPRGGLYFSVALRPQVALDELPPLALLVALALREGITRLQLIAHPDDLLIKWPNDVVLAQPDGAFCKVCGISSEYHAGGVCVGVGLNVLRRAAAETDGRYLPGYLSDRAGVRFEELANFDEDGALKEGGARVIVGEIVGILEGFLPRWEKEGFEPFADKYNSCSFLFGKSVAVANIMDDVQTTGIVCGIDAKGRLLVRTPRGEIEALVAGEAHLV